MASVMGVDPGLKGAVSLLNIDEIKTPGGSWLLIEMRANDFKRLIENYDVRHVYIEKAQAMPGQGTSSMFNYGTGFGKILGWCEMLNIPFTLVPPRTWTKELHKGCTGATSKDKSLQAFQRLFPTVVAIRQGCRVPHMGVVDALLITEYGRRVYK